MDTVNDIIDDLVVLAKAARDDYKSQRWETYDSNLTAYNEIQQRLRSLKLIDDLPYISSVPKEKRAMLGAGSIDEIAKTQEVATKCEQLLTRLQRRKTARPEMTEPHVIIRTICERFHTVARQLRTRHNNRPTLDVQDEYDAQDLMHALLKLHFHDVRPEEYTPSYAGKSSRMDFLLKDHDIVVELKHTRNNLTDKDIGRQLLDDIGRYQAHPNCKTIFCFVYNPEGMIVNPHGLEADLSKEHNGLLVHIYIAPK